MANVIEYIRDVIMQCPLLEGEAVNVDYIGEAMTYSIDALPCDPVLERYADGEEKKQFQFAFTSKEQYDEDSRVNIENACFFDKFEEWLGKLGNWRNPLPDMEEGQIPIRFEVKNKGYLYDVEEVYARYRIECRLIYEQEV